VKRERISSVSVLTRGKKVEKSDRLVRKSSAVSEERKRRRVQKGKERLFTPIYQRKRRRRQWGKSINKENLPPAGGRAKGRG